MAIKNTTTAKKTKNKKLPDIKNKKEYTEIRSIKLSKTEKIKIGNTDCLHKILSDVLKREGFINREKEHLWLIGCNTQDYILCIDTIALGNIEAVEVDSVRIFRNAILKGCRYVILAHNHPSGEVKPSKHDIKITDKIYQIGLVIDMPLKDHIIISLTTYFSFVVSNLMIKIEKSLKYAPPFKIKEVMQKEAKRIRNEALAEGKSIGRTEGLIEGRIEGEKKGISKMALYMAKAMKKDGFNTDTITKYTELTKEEIENL